MLSFVQVPGQVKSPPQPLFFLSVLFSRFFFFFILVFSFSFFFRPHHPSQNKKYVRTRNTNESSHRCGITGGITGGAVVFVVVVATGWDEDGSILRSIGTNERSEFSVSVLVVLVWIYFFLVFLQFFLFCCSWSSAWVCPAWWLSLQLCAPCD